MDTKEIKIINEFHSKQSNDLFNFIVSPSEFSDDYPLGGSLEPYDIERDKENE